ncbi:MAG: CHAT domain-containing tetratricopeptide repeat protein [Terriglobia bacterium]|nr:CHAT domain-containing tetratricopeptide repeat protein [Terriglobia bacterium]
MRFSPKRTQSVAVLVTCTVAIILVVAFVRYRNRRRIDSDSADALLRRADDLAWNGQWFAAAPIFHQAEIKFTAQRKEAEALYAQVSQIPAYAESASLADTIYALTRELKKPDAADPETRLRILEVRGMIENNYDANLARQTWSQVAVLARNRGHLLLASRALGEEGIAAFLLGDTTTAKKEVLTAWGVAKVFHDIPAQVRYASLYGAGLVELHRYQEGLKPLNEAIAIARSHPAVAYPAIAISSKIDALRGLHRYQEALTLANQALAEIPSPSLKGHYYQILTSRASVYEDLGQWDNAIADFKQALSLATQLDYWRGVTQVAGELADAYIHQNNLNAALASIDQAIDANKQIPDELYFVPRDLAIKARILAMLGHEDQAGALYRKSALLIDSLLENVPTPFVERLLLAETGEVYAGYFVLKCRGRDYDQALRILEEARGRIEAQALEHHDYPAPHAPTPAERHLRMLNVALLDTENPATRQELSEQVQDSESTLDQRSLASSTIEHPVSLGRLKADLAKNELFVEYVLADPHSYALAVTHSSARAYKLDARTRIETDANEYLATIRDQHENSVLGDTLFHELLGKIPEYRDHSTLILVPDGELDLLPFGAVTDRGVPLVESHTIATSPSATVFSILENKRAVDADPPLPYLGVAAWTKESKVEGPVFRLFSGFSEASLKPLPESKTEVETIASDLPKPSTLLLGGDATARRFRELPLSQFNVLHLALHGYVNTDYPDQSALVFAPEHKNLYESMLQVQQIRNLHLDARLVTLSACDTGVGPVGEEGVDNIVNAFIEAGADSVVSTLWELEDHTTEHLMAGFYARLGKGESKGEALRDAQRELIKEGVKPYYWASFELVGDPNGTI